MKFFLGEIKVRNGDFIFILGYGSFILYYLFMFEFLKVLN